MSYDFDEAMKLESQICFPLYAASRRVVSTYTSHLKPFGLTYTQYIVFTVLWEQDDIPIGEIGARVHLDSGTLTPLLKKLENAGYVTRERGKIDERTVNIRLTPEGHALKEKVRHIPTSMEQTMPLSESDAATLYRLLYQILQQ